MYLNSRKRNGEEKSFGSALSSLLLLCNDDKKPQRGPRRCKELQEVNNSQPPQRGMLANTLV